MNDIVTIPYTTIQIPPKGSFPAKTLYSPILKTFLFHKNEDPLFSFESIVDSGADFCVFPAEFGEIIGLNIQEGDRLPSFGVGGKETLYFHKVKVGIIIKNEMWRFECDAGFSTKLNAKGIGLLGRIGFFDLFKEVSFNQKTKMFRLKSNGVKPEKADFLFKK